MTRVPLGSWSTRSGNRVDVLLQRDDGRGHRELDIEWQRWPPSEGDLVDWLIYIKPDVVKRAQEFLEIPGLAVEIACPR